MKKINYIPVVSKHAYREPLVSTSVHRIYKKKNRAASLAARNHVINLITGICVTIFIMWFITVENRYACVISGSAVGTILCLAKTLVTKMQHKTSWLLYAILSIDCFIWMLAIIRVLMNN